MFEIFSATFLLLICLGWGHVVGKYCQAETSRNIEVHHKKIYYFEPTGDNKKSAGPSLENHQFADFLHRLSDVRCSSSSQY